ncbi:MAG: OmpA-OmpF porin, family [Sphingomonadales bacterium]|jgi:outer membrane protein OmpA-like peptidoglycan-associated protein|nr:OmpA-OmpF porin, family [Sphingomonadales bacterium]
MRKLAIAVALSSTLLATPAFARDGAWYVGGEFGAMIVEDTNVDIGAVDNAITLNHEYGYDGGLFVGYDLGAFRIEAEAAYKHADLESFNTTIRLPAEGVLFPASRPFAGGSSSALSFMVNGMLDFGDDDGISGFVGGGVGMARVKANNQRVFANTAPFLDGTDSKLAWQVFAGVRQAISDNIDVTVKYRFFNVDNVHLTAFNGNEAEYRFRSHSLLGGITFNFGGDVPLPPVPPPPPPVPPAPVPEPPAPPAPPPPCVAGPFMVFFDWDKDDITPQAAAILDNAASAYQTCGQAQVMIAGHADRSGSDQYNVGLSQRRAANVRSYLAGHGIPDGVMTTEAFGESRPLVETADGVREPQNRRVEISYGPGSGW